MSRRGVFDGSRQAEALRALLVRGPDGLKTRGGKTLTELAQEVGLSYGQLWRYVSGGLPLRSDQFAAFAEAFETTEGDLIRACFPSVVKDDTSVLRERLQAAGIDEQEIQDAESEIQSWHFSQSTMQRVADFLIESIRKHPRRSQASG